MEPINSGPSGNFQPASFLQRLAAYVIDCVIASIGVFVLAAVLGWFGYLVGFIGAIAYFVYLEGSRGQTPGKKIMNIKVVRSDGTPIDYGTAGWRLLSKVISGAVFDLGYLWMLWDPNRETWHDKLSGTRVVEAS